MVGGATVVVVVVVVVVGAIVVVVGAIVVVVVATTTALPTLSLTTVPGGTSVPEATLCVMTLPSFAAINCGPCWSSEHYQRVRGNPVRLRDCPAAVSEHESTTRTSSLELGSGG